MTVLKRRIDGIPASPYCDKKNAFVPACDPAGKELLAGVARPKSRFGKARDRPVKELRLARISSFEQADAFLRAAYTPLMNSNFSRPSGNADDAHARVDSAAPDDILRLEYGRKAGNDYAVPFEARMFRIPPETKPNPRPDTDASVHIFWKNKGLHIKACTSMKLRPFSTIDAPIVPFWQRHIFSDF
jgi:hypothetical protein